MQNYVKTLLMCMHIGNDDIFPILLKNNEWIVIMRLGNL